MSERKVFVLFDDANQLTIADIKENIPPNALLIGSLLSTCPPEEDGGHDDHFQSLADLGLHVCRRFHLLKNDRTLYLPLDDVFAKIDLLLSQHNKKAFGSGETEISDVLDIFRCVRAMKNQLPGELLDSVLDQTGVAEEYVNNLMEDNLVDQFDLVRALRSKLLDDGSAILDYLSRYKTVLLVQPQFNGKSADIDLLRLLLPCVQTKRVVVETSLDWSIHGGDDDGDHNRGSSICFEDFELRDAVEGERVWGGKPKESATGNYCQQLIQGYLRLLINSRDELALARIVCGPCGVMNHKAFTAIKRESLRARMPMFQTIVSYVQKMELGGKVRYVPTAGHPFFEFNKNLVDFAAFMEKLQRQIEEEKRPKEALLKMGSIMRCHIVKSSKLKSASVEDSFAKYSSLVQAALRSVERLDSNSSTPLRNAGSGGSMVGRKVMKVVREIVDLYSTSAATKVDLHRLLGKIPAEDGSTPVPSAGCLFKSPDATLQSDDMTEDVDEASLGDRLGLQDILTGQPKKSNVEGRKKLGCTFSWAPETSPVFSVPDGSIVTTSGPTLVCADPGTPVSLGKRSATNEEFEVMASENDQMKKAKVRLDEAVNASKMLKKLAPKKLPKRSILKDIVNMKKPSMLQENPKEATPDGNYLLSKTAPILKLTAKPVETKAKSSKGRKREPVPMKGQTKMTSFFRM